MSARRQPRPLLAAALGAAIVVGLLVDWTPRSWRIAVAMAALTIVGVVWALTSRSFDLPRQMAVVIPIGAWAALQLCFHTSVAPESTAHGAAIWAMCAVAFFLGSQILRDRESRAVFLDILLWASTALAILAMLQFYTAHTRVFWIFPADDSVIGTFHYQNQFAAFMELMAPIALWQTVRGKPLAGAVGYAVMLAATLTSQSRMGFILVAADFPIFLGLVMLQRRSALRSLRLMAAMLVVSVSCAVIVAGTQQTLGRFQEKDLYQVRRQMSASTLKMVEERPWLGFGIGAWPAAYPKFATFDLALLTNEAHNDWLQWASEGGIPFMLLIAGLVVWLAMPAIGSIWGLGLLVVMVHSYVDYLLREPAIAFAWFTVAGALSRFTDTGRSDGSDELLAERSSHTRQSSSSVPGPPGS